MYSVCNAALTWKKLSIEKIVTCCVTQAVKNARYLF